VLSLYRSKNCIGFMICIVLSLVVGCGGAPSNQVTIYTSVDRDYSEPIIALFQEQNPELSVKVVYDSELTKTTGLYQRLLQEKKNPQADVFWNNEIVRTIQLKQADALAQYKSAAAGDIPDAYKDPDGFWTGFSARARVMIINNEIIPETVNETPASIPSLSNVKFRGKTGMAKPEFGTTVTHMAALYTYKKDVLRYMMNRAKSNQMKLFPGNASVRDAVVRGDIAYGMTDTDDVFAALDEGKAVRMAFLDQKQHGTLLIPNTVALIKNSPNQDGGKKLVDFLLSHEVESKLAQSRARQIPLRAAVTRPDGVPDISSIKIMEVDFNKVAENVEPCLELMRTIFP